MNRWYRSYEGTVSDPKLHEAALVAGVSRSVVVATWHSILESCTATESAYFEITPRRVALILAEKPKTIESVFESLGDLGLIADGKATKWNDRQFKSDTSTERVKRFRNKKETAGETPVKRFGNAPETETETETETEQYPPTPDGGDVGVLGHLPTDSENTGTGPKRHTHTEPMVNSYFGIWNRLGLPEFRKLLLNVPNHGELLEALSYYAPTEVIAAVEAYATVQSDPAYSMAFRYQTVVSFLIKGLESFAPGARPLEVYRAKAPGPASRENSSADQVADIVAQAEEIARRNREVAV